MRKIFIFLLIFTGLNIGEVKSQNTTATIWATGTILDSIGKAITYHYTVKQGQKMYWGCNSKVVPYHSQYDYLEEVIVKNKKDTFILTCIPIQTDNQERVLNFLLTFYIKIKHQNKEDSFLSVFENFSKYKNEKYWEVKILTELN